MGTSRNDYNRRINRNCVWQKKKRQSGLSCCPAKLLQTYQVTVKRCKKHHAVCTKIGMIRAISPTLSPFSSFLSPAQLPVGHFSPSPCSGLQCPSQSWTALRCCSSQHWAGLFSWLVRAAVMRGCWVRKWDMVLARLHRQHKHPAPRILLESSIKSNTNLLNFYNKCTQAITVQLTHEQVYQSRFLPFSESKIKMNTTRNHQISVVSGLMQTMCPLLSQHWYFNGTHVTTI